MQKRFEAQQAVCKKDVEALVLEKIPSLKVLRDKVHRLAGDGGTKVVLDCEVGDFAEGECRRAGGGAGEIVACGGGGTKNLTRDVLRFG